MSPCFFITTIIGQERVLKVFYFPEEFLSHMSRTLIKIPFSYLDIANWWTRGSETEQDLTLDLYVTILSVLIMVGSIQNLETYIFFEKFLHESTDEEGVSKI